MKRTLLFSLLLAPATYQYAMAQTKASGIPAIKVATSGPQNEGKLLSFSAYTKEKGFYVDYGNGNTIDYPWAGTVVFSDRTYGDTIRIYSHDANDPILQFSCKDDSIKSIAVDNAPELQLLDFSGNLISSVDLSKNTQLQKVCAARNSLVLFNFPAGVNLTYLDVSQNKLEALDVSSSDKLEYLDASVNNMRAPLNLKWSESTVLKHLDLSCNMFFNLNSLPKYSNLEFFAFNHNKISAIDLSKYPKLKTIKAQYNTNLSTIDYLYCPDLTYLDVSGTKLTSLNFSKNKNLETLKATLLSLSDIDLSATPNLKSLTVEKSNLKALDLSKNTILQNIDVAGNALTSLDLSKNTELTNVDCHNNAIATLDIAQLTKLDTLNCSINKIEALNIANNKNLKNLNCSSNNISELNIKSNTDLRYLNFADNEISQMSFAAQLDLEGASASGNQMDKNSLEAMFSSLPDINGIEIDEDDALWKGVLTYNNNPGTETADATTLTAKGWKSQASADALGDASAMAVISPELIGTKFMFAIDCAADMQIDWGDGKKVYYKYDAKNGSYQNIEGVLKGSNLKIYAPEAVDLGIANTSVAQLNVSNMPKLKYLACSGNAISDLDVSKNEALEKLTCSNNPLIFLNLGEAKSLQALFCENTQIKSLDFSNCKNLVTLDLQKNRLQTLNVAGCTSLQALDATYNELKEIDLSASSDLTTFFADKNQLESLNLSNNTMLENLSVGSNKLKTLDLSDLKNLGTVYCNDNQLTDLKVASNYLSVLQAQNNQIADIDLTKCPALSVLAINNNKLNSLDLSLCSVLQRLWVNDNNLTALGTPDGGWPKLGVINISNNQFSSFDFSVSPWCTEIVASGNKLSGTVDLSECKSLDKFFGSDNQIEEIKFSGSALTTLVVNNNKLKSLNVPSGGLYWCEANNNELVAVNVSASGNLNLLHLDNNKINSLNLSGKDKIISLSLRNNLFESNALNRIYEQLPDISGTEVSADYSSWMTWIFVNGNPGAKDADASIVKNKGWNIDVDGETAIDAVSTDKPAVAYNRNTGCIEFADGTDIKSARIISANGTSMSISANSFNMSNLPDGIYIISYSVDGKKYAQKILK